MVNLEGRNLGELDDQVVPEPVGLVTVDLSYLALAEAIPQLERLSIAIAPILVAGEAHLRAPSAPSLSS